VAERVREPDRLTHADVRATVADAADAVEAETGRTFGTTVRENATAAAWAAVAADPTPDLSRLVDEVTTCRKEEVAIEGVADRLADKFGTLEDSRHRLTRAELVEFVNRSAERTEEATGEAFGETAREKVVDAVWDQMRTVEDDLPSVAEIAADRDVAAEFLDAMEATDILAPPTNCLSPITPEDIRAGLEKEFDADFYAAATRDAEVHSGDPFIVEAGVAYGGELATEGAIDVLRFANRVPLVYQRGACATASVVKNIGWRNYGLDQPGGSGMPAGPCVLLIHVASTNVPFTSESKDAIAAVPEIEDEIELAVREVARDLKSYLQKRRSMQKRRQKQDVLAGILPTMAEKVAEVTDRDPPEVGDAMARIMNNVLVERVVEDGTVRLTVENNSDTDEVPEVTDIVTADAEPEGLPEAVQAVEMDGEWFLTWTPEVPAGESATLEYETASDAEFDLSVEGVEEAKLTVNGAED